ncbi:MAG: EAL domain-containing protein [Actinomycetes bacterium]
MDGGAHPDEAGAVAPGVQLLPAGRALAFHQLVERSFSSLLTLSEDQVDAGLTQMLGELTTFLGADRGYVVTYDFDERRTTMTHEWCVEGVPSAIESEQACSFDDYPQQQARILNHQINEVRDTSQLPPGWEHDGAYFEAEGITAILEVPFFFEGQVKGLVGFDLVSGPASWQPEDLPLLRSVAALTEQVLARQITAETVRMAVGQSAAVFERSPLGILVLNNDGLIVEANQAAARLFSVPTSHLLGSFGFMHLHPDDAPRVNDLWRNLVANPDVDSATIEVRTHALSGHRWIRCDIACLRSADGAIAQCTVHLADIERSRATDAALTLSLHRFDRLVEALPEAVVVLDAAGEVQTANPAAVRLRRLLLDAGLTEVDGWPVLPKAASDRLDRAVGTARRTGRPTTYELHLACPDRTEVWVEGTVVPDPQAATGSGHTLVYRDVSHRRRQARDLEHQATHDDLTGLPNRTAFMQRLGQECRRIGGDRTSVAVLFFDLDDFKTVNDSLGHEAGDRLLREVAVRVRDRLRSGDLLARFGGDEFTALLLDTDEAAAVSIANSVRDSLAQASDSEYRQFAITTSIGVVVADSPDANPSHLLRWADAALYRAKERGRNQVAAFDDDLRRAVTERVDMGIGLREALDEGRIEVHFQPEVDLRTGRVRGVEALARWRHPHLGLLPAGRFIPLAEENGSIVPIGWEVLGASCHTVAEWRRQGLVGDDFVLRVNLSPRQLDEPFMAGRLAAVLEHSGLPPAQLCLEITETTLMRNAEDGMAALERLRQVGVRLAIDDFGTGYSSLHLLKQLPIDVVKIDRSFVDGLPDDPEDRAIVATIIGLVDLLGLSATAEGVESAEQGDALLELGCTYAQGFHFARPCPPEELLPMLRRASSSASTSDR